MAEEKFEHSSFEDPETVHTFGEPRKDSPDSHVVAHHYKPEIEEKAKEMSYFYTDPPKNIVEGIGGTEYNLVKGAAAGTAMLVTAPFIGAYDDCVKETDPWLQTLGVFTGFGKGLVRGVGGAVMLAGTGAITGLNQLRTGIQENPDAPGHGSGMKENWEHVVNSSYMDLCMNVEPDCYQAELDALIASGKLPPKKYDVEGREIPYKYEFFLTDEPQSFYDGFNVAQYNIGKGFISGATLAVTAPFKDAYEQFNETDEKGKPLGFEGAVKGFGSGCFRGFVGGCMLTGAGMVYGAGQIARGFVSLQNIPAAAHGIETTEKDFGRLHHEPLFNLVLQKGYGLEEFLEKEEERMRLEAEKKQWYEQHPGEIHPADAAAGVVISPNPKISPVDKVSPASPEPTATSQPPPSQDAAEAAAPVVVEEPAPEDSADHDHSI